MSISAASSFRGMDSASRHLHGQARAYDITLGCRVLEVWVSASLCVLVVTLVRSARATETNNTFITIIRLSIKCGDSDDTITRANAQYSASCEQC
jgi:hypothetical protein